MVSFVETKAENVEVSETHILVVDDDARLRKLLQEYLSTQGFFVVTAEDANVARQKLALLRFDAMVVDRMMPGEDGISLIRSLADSPMPMLMLTAMGDAQDRIEGLEAGARDYLSKPFEPKELVLRLNNLLRQQPVSGRTLRFGEYAFDMNRKELQKDGELVHLTDNELEYLAILAATPGEPVSREKLSGGEGSDRSIDVQINRLRKKLEEDAGRPRYIRTARGEGYVLNLS